MFLIGLTGGIASGKSTVSKIIIDLGIPVIDADKIARQIVQPGKPAWRKIKKQFGSDVMFENGELNRPVLAQLIFNDSEKRKQLNAITHPEIFKQMMWDCLYYLFTGQQCVLLDLPLLYETKKYLPFVEYVIVVYCNEQQQIERMVSRNGYTVAEARTRMESQMSLDHKCKMADYVVDNAGSIEETKKQVACIVQDMRDSKAHWKLRILLFSLLTCTSAITAFCYFSAIKFFY